MELENFLCLYNGERKIEVLICFHEYGESEVLASSLEKNIEENFEEW